jgi:hypothetical protein
MKFCEMRFILKHQYVGRSNYEKLLSIVPLIASCFFSGVLLALCGAEEQTGQTENDNGGTSAAASAINQDSLRAEIQRLRRDADVLRDEAARLVHDSTASGQDASPNVNLTNGNVGFTPDSAVAKYPKKDTVELLSKETVAGFLQSFNGKKRTARERGYGGGIGPAMGVFAINMGPVDDLVDFMEGDAAFKHVGLKIDKPFALFQLSGISFYGAVGNGLRIGGIFLGGSRSYSSHVADTTYNLEINPSFGGFLLEKALVYDDFNLFFGGLLGGSTIEARPSKTNSVFTSIPLDVDNDNASFNELKARSFLLELHGGFTYTMINWFHVGAELSGPIFFSPSGFTTTGGHSITNGFISINPGIRIRIIIGNIG